MSFLGRLQPERRLEILGVLMLALTAALFIALVTDGHQGQIRRPLEELAKVPNALGAPGAVTAGFLYILVGHAAHVIYFLTCVWGLMLISHRPLDRLGGRCLGSLLLVFSIAALLHVDFAAPDAGNIPGGMIGSFFASIIAPTFGVIGANVFTITLAAVGILLATEFLLIRFLDKLRTVTTVTLIAWANMLRVLYERWRERRERRAEAAEQKAESEDVPAKPRRRLFALAGGKLKGDADKPRDLSEIRIRPEVDASRESEPPFAPVPEVASTAEAPAEAEAPKVVATAEEPDDERQLEIVAEEPVSAKPAAETAKPEIKRLPRRRTPVDEIPADYVYPKRYTRPRVDLLTKPNKPQITDLGDQLRATSALLEDTLQTFGIEARVTDVTRGPTITRFEIQPAPGVKVSRFHSLADDIALALKAHRVRVVAPIPGKGRVGIEVPNKHREPVVLRELIESQMFRRAPCRLPLTLGKDIAGDSVVTGLAEMPHLLVAGATGAGKTVCVKALLASLLFSRTPDELQLMLIDPKMVELSIFNDIPHLITPVVTDPKKASSALNWLIVEMNERYRLFSHLRVRNIEIYNASVENGEIEMPQGQGGSESVSVIRKLPYIVCVIDELADLMMLARAEVEDAIGRLAQLARAVGIHLIIATQRPSVDVLTGVIKANFPARISFQVSSRVDSRCILDEIGAERLIGRGDMLYLPAGQAKPTRIQGAFVSDEEMMALIGYLKTQAPPQYRDEIENFGKSDALTDLEDETDELLDEAVQVVLDTGQASISMVQRKLRVGYTRAARLIDMMEIRGIVGPHIGSKAREILVDLPRTDEVA